MSRGAERAEIIRAGIGRIQNTPISTQDVEEALKAFRELNKEHEEQWTIHVGLEIDTAILMKYSGERVNAIKQRLLKGKEISPAEHTEIDTLTKIWDEVYKMYEYDLKRCDKSLLSAKNTLNRNIERLKGLDWHGREAQGHQISVNNSKTKVADLTQQRNELQQKVNSLKNYKEQLGAFHADLKEITPPPHDPQANEQAKQQDVVSPPQEMAQKGNNPQQEMGSAMPDISGVTHRVEDDAVSEEMTGTEPTFTHDNDPNSGLGEHMRGGIVRGVMQAVKEPITLMEQVVSHAEKAAKQLEEISRITSKLLTLSEGILDTENQTRAERLLTIRNSAIADFQTEVESIKAQLSEDELPKTASDLINFLSTTAEHLSASIQPAAEGHSEEDKPDEGMATQLTQAEAALSHLHQKRKNLLAQQSPLLELQRELLNNKRPALQEEQAHLLDAQRYDERKELEGYEFSWMPETATPMEKNKIYLQIVENDIGEKRLYYGCITPDGTVITSSPLNGSDQKNPYSPPTDIKYTDDIERLDRGAILNILLERGHASRLQSRPTIDSETSKARFTEIASELRDIETQLSSIEEQNKIIQENLTEIESPLQEAQQSFNLLSRQVGQAEENAKRAQAEQRAGETQKKIQAIVSLEQTVQAAITEVTSFSTALQTDIDKRKTFGRDAKAIFPEVIPNDDALSAKQKSELATLMTGNNFERTAQEKTLFEEASAFLTSPTTRAEQAPPSPTYRGSNTPFNPDRGSNTHFNSDRSSNFLRASVVPGGGPAFVVEANTPNDAASLQPKVREGSPRGTSQDATKRPSGGVATWDHTTLHNFIVGMIKTVDTYNTQRENAAFKWQSDETKRVLIAITAILEGKDATRLNHIFSPYNTKKNRG